MQREREKYFKVIKFYSPKNDIDTDDSAPDIKGPPRR